MSIPVMAIAPATCLMLADYNEKLGDKEMGYHWLRIAVILQTVADYNNGACNEETLNDYLHAAIHGRNERVVEITKGVPRS